MYMIRKSIKHRRNNTKREPHLFQGRLSMQPQKLNKRVTDNIGICLNLNINSTVYECSIAVYTLYSSEITVNHFRRDEYTPNSLLLSIQSSPSLSEWLSSIGLYFTCLFICGLIINVISSSDNIASDIRIISE
jgi:hypothetical protein